MSYRLAVAVGVFVLGLNQVGQTTDVSVDSCSPPLVQTDAKDYLPGTTANISGCGFLAGETVILQVLHIDGTTNDGENHGTWIVVADDAGNFQTTWLVCEDDCRDSSLAVTATGQASGWSDTAIFADDCPTCFNAVLQGQSFGSTAWQTGSLTNWQELDFIPMRVFLTNGPMTTLVTVEFEHTKTAGNKTKPGIENLYSFSPSANVSITAGPTLSALPGVDTWSYSFSNSFTGGTGVGGFVDFYSRLSAGSHVFKGNSLKVQGSPNLGKLSINAPAPATGSNDLAIVKTGPTNANPSQLITYVLSYTNQAGDHATGVQVTDNLPANVAFVSCSGGCSLLGNTLTWDIGNIARRGSGSFIYQVTVSPAAINGSTFSNLATIAGAEEDTNSVNDTSSVVTKVVNGCIPPVINASPSDATLCSGESVDFVVVANGTSPLSYQWRKNGGNLTDGGNLSGATTDTLTINPVASGDDGSYDAVVTNACGSATSGAANLSFNAAPQITCPLNITNSAELGQCSAHVNFASPTATGTPTPTVVCTPASGTEFPVGTTTVNCTASNGCGTSSCSFNVTVIDIEPPSVTCPAGTTNSVGANCQAEIPDMLAGLIASDICTPAGSLSKSQEPTAGTPVGLGTQPITITVVDAAGNSNTCTTSFTAVDRSEPDILVCAPAVTNSADDGCQAKVPVFTNAVVATDNCTASGELRITQSPPANALVGLGTTNVTLYVVDAAGNTNTCTTSFTVLDITRPSITCPGATTNSADANCQAPIPNVVAGLIASDNCTPSGSLIKSQDPSAGTPVGLGTHPITVTVVDASGNTNTCTTSFTVEDHTAPRILTCAPAVTNSADASCQAQVPNFTTSVTAADNCSGVLITQSPSAGMTVGLGTTAVTLYVVDTAGNTNTCTSSFTVRDTTPPSVSCPAATTNAAGANCQAAVPNVLAGVVASDNCTPTASLVKSQNPTAGTLVGLGTHTITVTVVDGGNNTNTCTTSFTVVDRTPPTISCAPDINTNADAGVCSVSNLAVGTPTASDLCPGNVTVQGVRSDAQPLNAPYPVCNTFIVWTATDDGGNSAICTQRVVVRENVSLRYTGDLFVSTAGPTVGNAQVLLAAHLTPDAACLDVTQLQVRFRVFLQNNLSSTPVADVTVPVNSAGNASILVPASVGQYSIVACLVPNACWTSADDTAALTVDYGSNDRRVTGGGFIGHALSQNGKANFGFTVAPKSGGGLKGNSIYVVRGTDGYNYLIKGTSWQGGALTLISDSTGHVYKARFNGKCAIQKIDRLTETAVASQGNCSFIVEIKDGDVYNPDQKDQYAITVTVPGSATPWWGSCATMSDLGAGGPGGGNVVIHTGK